MSILRRLLLGLRGAAAPDARLRSAPGRNWSLVVSRFRRVRQSKDVQYPFNPSTNQTAINVGHEHRLLRALSAGQVGAVNLVEFYLRKITRNYELLALLTVAITSLAKELELRGYHLPQSSQFQEIPAAALNVVRAGGQDLRTVRVAWPPSID